MEENEKNTSENPQSGVPAAGKSIVGRTLRSARERAGISADRLCADLRIAPSTLEALESGNYGVLAGAPYVRAMLVSLSRYLHLDQKDLLQAYAEESGNKPAAPTISPYKDDSPTHARAHKQIFILLLAVLLFVLLLIMGKFSTGDEALEPAVPTAPADTLLNLDPLPEPEDPAPMPPEGDTETTDTSAAAILDEEDEAEGPRETRVRLLGISDSVWVRVLPAGQREVSDYLSSTRPMEFTHTDAITFITRQSRSVRVLLRDTVIVPNRRRFVVDGERFGY